MARNSRVYRQPIGCQQRASNGRFRHLRRHCDSSNSDYVPASGTLLFAPGEVLQSISIMVREDSTDEPDEAFFVALSTPVNATIADSQGQGSILNDDVSLAAGPHLRVGRVWASTMDWTTVPLNHDYGANMVVVCTANYDKNPAGAVATPGRATRAERLWQ